MPGDVVRTFKENRALRGGYLARGGPRRNTSRAPPCRRYRRWDILSAFRCSVPIPFCASLVGDKETESLLWRGVYGVAVALVLGFFLFSLRPILNPFLLFLLLLVLISPQAGSRYHVLVLAYVLHPLVNQIARFIQTIPDLIEAAVGWAERAQRELPPQPTASGRRRDPGADSRHRCGFGDRSADRG